MVDTSGQRSKPVCTMVLRGSTRFYSLPCVLFCSGLLLLRSTALENKTCSNTKRHKTLALMWTLFKWRGNHKVSLFIVDLFPLLLEAGVNSFLPHEMFDSSQSLWGWPVAHVFNWLKMGQINTPTDTMNPPTLCPSKLGEFRGGF